MSGDAGRRSALQVIVTAVLINVMTWMRRAFAGAFVAVAARLALTQR